MGTRSMWKGTLNVSLVSVPVRMISANQPKSKTTISFNRLHAKCKGRLKSKSYCPACDEELGEGESLKGYEYSKGKYVIIDDGELDACEAAASHTLEITGVVDDDVNPVYVDSMAYLIADGPMAAKAFETLRQSIGKRLAVGQVVLSKTNTLVALRAADANSAFIVHRLMPREDVRLLEDLAGDMVPVVAPGKNDVQLATMLFDQLEGTLDYEAVKDEYTEQVRALIEAKAQGKKPTLAAAPPPPTASSDLFTQLQASLAKLPKKAAKPAKATMPEAAPKRKRA